MANNHESVLWVVMLNPSIHHGGGNIIFRTRAAARDYLKTRFGIVAKAVWGPDNIKAKAK